MKLGLRLAEQQLLPDMLVRAGIKRLLRQRLEDEDRGSEEKNQLALMRFARQIKSEPLAIQTQRANEQHYEVPAEFFQMVLGKHLKYSSCLFDRETTPLDQAEEAMLKLTMDRAELSDGQRILELGCGWGSLSLAMAQRFPQSSVTAISNSSSQREFIEARARELQLKNLSVQTVDMNEFAPSESFDRIVSVEMFEHMRNYELLMQKISQWLNPNGKLFVHIFCHRRHAYLFEEEGDSNWMGKYFFSGGMMPSRDLLLYFQKHLCIEDQWVVGGHHYAETCERWLSQLDAKRDEVLPVLARVYGEDQKLKWLQRWRIFFMSCAELFAYREGNEWYVAHYRFRKR